MISIGMQKPIMQERERSSSQVHNHFQASEGRSWSISGGEKKLMENDKRKRKRKYLIYLL
jgi:hypothetical protein